MRIRIFMYSFYYMFKLYKLLRDHLKMKIYLFQHMKFDGKKSILLLRYYTME